jgi:hypothetical protein
MPLPSIPGVVRAAVRGTVATGQQWTNVHHFRYAGGASSPGTVELDGLDVELFRFYSGTNYTSPAGAAAWLTSGCASSTTMTQIDYTVLDGAALMYTKSHAVTGAGAGNALPAECAPVLTLRTDRRGRRYRGRIYLPAPVVSGTDASGRLTSSMTTGAMSQYLGMKAALVAKQWAPVVASYGKGTLNGVPTTWAPFATDVLTVTMDPQVDVQRRRKS